MITVKYAELILLIFLALISDIKTYKIKNKIVFPFMLAGLVTNFISSGFEGCILSLQGLALPIILLFILFILRMLGAGDIKLFSTIGGIMGPTFALYTIAYAFLAGGIIAIIIMMIHKNGRKRLKYLLSYLKSCFLTLSFQEYIDFEGKKEGATFRFAYAIVCGTLATLILN